MAKVFGEKVKRVRINWFKVLDNIEDKELWRRFYAFKYRHPTMSDNRIAYYVIKRSYSTTTLTRFTDYFYSHFYRCNAKWFFGVSL